MAATAVTLNDLECHSQVAGFFKCNPSNICAAFYTISTDSVLARSLCISRASCHFGPRRSRSTAAYSRQTFPWSICRSVGPYVRTCVGRWVCPVHCWKTADRIRMPFGIIGRTRPGMRQVRFGDRSMGRGTFGGEFEARHCNQWGLYGVRVPQRRDAALFPNYFGQTCYNRDV